MVDVLDEYHLDAETENLDKFYDSIRRRVEGIPPHDAEARQRIIKDLYGRFFRIAFPKVAESLGIVYTPIEVVDFIIRATEAALSEHFGDVSLSDPGVHILDPFTGTGTFITRLLQTGHIKPQDLARKYAEEIHANEILLLAYYIAAVNVETTYRQQLTEQSGIEKTYEAFPGIVLTDTFQLGETGEGDRRDRCVPHQQRTRQPTAKPRHPCHHWEPPVLGRPRVGQRQQPQPRLSKPRRCDRAQVCSSVDRDAEEQPL